MLHPDISTADIEAVNYERFHHPSPIVQKRMHVIFLKAHHFAHHEIALMAGLHPNSVTNTLKTYTQDGLEALKKLNYRKPQSQLSAHQSTIEAHFKAQPPLSVAEAGARIEEMTGLKRGPSQVRAYMRHIGMRYQKMGQIPAKANPEAQAAFLSQTLEPLIERAQAGQCHLFFVDAAHFVLGPFLCAVWCFTRCFLAADIGGQAPAGRKRYNVLGALDAVTRELEVVTNTGYVNAETVAELIGHLARHYGALPIYLVMDNARYQRCKFVQQVAQSLGVNLVFLTSYSPNLNLIERLWKFVKKKVLYGKYYDSFDKFREAIDGCLSDINQAPGYRDELESLLTLKFQTFSFSQNLAA